jgi:hypothetical protein
MKRKFNQWRSTIPPKSQNKYIHIWDFFNVKLRSVTSIYIYSDSISSSTLNHTLTIRTCKDTRSDLFFLNTIVALEFLFIYLNRVRNKICWYVEFSIKFVIPIRCLKLRHNLLSMQNKISLRSVTYTLVVGKYHNKSGKVPWY